MKLKPLLLVAIVAGLFLPSMDPQKSAADEFYKGKTITLIQGRAPGGTGDIRIRAVMPFLQKHIPGNPIIVSEFMPGAGGRKAANHIFKNAEPDGLTIGNVGSGIVSAAILGEPGVSYDPDRFSYLGSPYSTHQAVFVSRKEAGFDGIEKLRKALGIRIGGQTVGHSVYIEGRLFAYFIGLKEPRFVTGYSGPELDVALMRGEIDARATSADTVARRNPEWLEKKLVDFHATIDVPKGERHPRFTHLPELDSFARSENDRKLITMQRAFRVVGQPFILPFDTPRDRVKILQEAFRKIYQDPEFHEHYKKLTTDDATPLLPEAQETVIRAMPRDREVGQMYKKLMGSEPLPTHDTMK
jgi:tripartite-type tricarboxylate transporter receptor subunit TctC